MTRAQRQDLEAGVYDLVLELANDFEDRIRRDLDLYEDLDLHEDLDPDLDLDLDRVRDAALDTSPDPGLGFVFTAAFVVIRALGFLLALVRVNRQTVPILDISLDLLNPRHRALRNALNRVRHRVLSPEIGGEARFTALRAAQRRLSYLAAELDIADSVPQSRVARPTKMSLRLARAAVCLLPDIDRPRYNEEYGAELADLAKAPRRAQIVYGLRVLRFSVQLRLALKYGAVNARVNTSVDWLVISESRTCKLVATVMILAGGYLFFRKGMIGVLENGENLAAIGAGLYGAAFVVRRVRKLEQPKSPPSGPDS